jgi:hypothetical protein
VGEPDSNDPVNSCLLCSRTAQGVGYGLIKKEATPGRRSGSARRANSQSSDRVRRGSMISSTQKRSAERNGERSLFSRSSI